MYTKQNLLRLSCRTVLYGCLIVVLVLSSPGGLGAVGQSTGGDHAPQSQTQDQLAFLPLITRYTCTYCYYVDSVNGSDSNSGTSMDKPWRTIGKVNEFAIYTGFRPGSWIHFKRGATYTGTLRIGNSGNASAPIIFTAYGTGDKPIITDPSSTEWWGGVIAVRANYVIVENLHVKDSRAAGVVFQDTSSHNIARNLEVSNAGWGIISAGQYNLVTGNYIHDLQSMDGNALGGRGVGVFGSNSEFSFNRVVNCVIPTDDYPGGVGGGFEFYGQVENNYLHHNWVESVGGFIEIGGGYANNTTVAYNVFYNHKWFFYLNNGYPYGSSVSNFRIENNTIIAVHPVWIWALFHFGGESGSLYASEFIVRNNVIYLDSDNAWVTDDSGITHDHNLYYVSGTWSGVGPDFTLGAGEQIADPLFLDLAGRNLHLQSSSPAINKGANLGYTFDLDGRQVPVGPLPDLGAFEFSN